MQLEWEITVFFLQHVQQSLRGLLFILNGLDVVQGHIHLIFSDTCHEQFPSNKNLYGQPQKFETIMGI